MRLLSCLALLIVLFSSVSCHKYAAPSTAVTCTTTTAATSTTSSISSCTDPVTGITVTISPVTVSLNVATNTQFQAAVSGGTNTVITWQVNKITGGNDTVGRIDSNGLYRAPATLPSPASVNVMAVSFEDSNVSATAVATLLPPPQVTIAPTSWTLTAGVANTKTFAGTVTGANTTNVDWEVNGILGGNSTFGTISAAGVYTAPLTPPLGSTVTVTAVSNDFPTALASATVTISGYSTSSLQGQFAFSIAGQILSGASAGPFFRAGSFSADGAGNLNGGLEDINETSGVTSGISFVGTYTVSTDGRGTLNFSDSHAPANLPSNFNFVLVNGSQLQITGLDASITATYPGTAAGQANLQNASTFISAPLSALSGTYVFDFSGAHGSNSLSQIGEFTSDGAGHITGGSIDINDGGTSNLNPFQIKGLVLNPPNPPAYPSFYSINSNGRGAATIATSDPAFPTLTFSFYIVSRGSAKFVGTDTTQALAGITMQQAPNATFDQSSLNGNYAFLLQGSGPGGTIATETAGSFFADGNLNFTSGVLDENVGGTPNTNVAFGGSYSVTSNGRGTATFTGGRTYLFYLGPTGTAVFQESDSIHPNIVSDGVFTQQQSAAFSLASIQGNYAIETRGLSASSAQVISGQWSANGAGIVPSGAIDINTAGTLIAGEGVTGTYTTPASNGRATLTLNPSTDNRNFAVYVVNSTEVFVLGIDTGRLAVGGLLRQF